MTYNLNNLPDLEELEDFKVLLRDVFLDNHRGKYPKISHICGTCFHLFNLGDENGVCGLNNDKNRMLDSPACKDWVENDETVEWLELFGLLGIFPKVSKCKNYSSSDYRKSQRGEWNCMFYEKGTCVYEDEGNETILDKDGKCPEGLNAKPKKYRTK